MPTFFHENGKDKSEIDYILTKANPKLIFEPPTDMQKDPVNLSGHTSLSITLAVAANSSPKGVTVSVNPKWITCNIGLYKETARNNLRKSFGNRNLQSNSMYDVHCQIRDLTNVLKSAAKTSIPRYKTEIVKKKLKPHCKWTPDIYAAIRECRRSWGEWKAAGQPDQEAAPNYFISMNLLRPT